MDHLVVEQVLLLQPEDLESLLLRHKFAAYSKALYGYLPAAIKLELIRTPNELFPQILAYFL